MSDIDNDQRFDDLERRFELLSKELVAVTIDRDSAVKEVHKLFECFELAMAEIDRLDARIDVDVTGTIKRFERNVQTIRKDASNTAEDLRSIRAEQQSFAALANGHALETIELLSNLHKFETETRSTSDANALAVDHVTQRLEELSAQQDETQRALMGRDVAASAALEDVLERFTALEAVGVEREIEVFDKIAALSSAVDALAKREDTDVRDNDEVSTKAEKVPERLTGDSDRHAVELRAQDKVAPQRSIGAVELASMSSGELDVENVDSEGEVELTEISEGMLRRQRDMMRSAQDKIVQVMVRLEAVEKESARRALHEEAAAREGPDDRAIRLRQPDAPPSPRL